MIQKVYKKIKAVWKMLVFYGSGLPCNPNRPEATVDCIVGFCSSGLCGLLLRPSLKTLPSKNYAFSIRPEGIVVFEIDVHFIWDG
ncbi:MAG: hypothetical protein IH597_07535 [Bacteroidales bacterium]|nr:hypothetical protein [Bacteroidales bacterium]